MDEAREGLSSLAAHDQLWTFRLLTIRMVLHDLTTDDLVNTLGGVSRRVFELRDC